MSLASNSYVIQTGRRMGKTYQVQTIIHDLILDGKRSSILVVLPNQQHVHFFVRAWQERYPHMPMVEYTTATNMLKTRGKHYGNVIIEDIDTYEHGIYDPQFLYLWGALDQEYTVLYTASEIPSNQRNARYEPPTVKSVLAEANKRRRWRKK